MVDSRRLTARGLVVLTAACLFLAGPSLARADQPEKDKREVPAKNSAKFLAAFHSVVTPAVKSTVRIRSDDKDVALGTVVASDGWVLTKASELGDKTVCRLRDGREFEARLVGVHPQYDVALLKIEVQDLTPVAWLESKSAAVGNWVASVGTGETPVAVGVVSVATRSLSPRELALPLTSPNSGFLGIGLDKAEEGPKVTTVTPKSAAEKAGIKVNDVVLTLAGRPVKDPETLIGRMAKTKPGQTVVLKIKRGDAEMEFTIKLDKRPIDRGALQNSMGSKLSNRRTGFPTFLQHDTVLKPTDCGGPLVDLEGRVVGINIARAGRTESYALPSEAVIALLPDLKSGKLAPKSEATELLAEKVQLAKEALKKAEAAKAAADKKVAEAQAAKAAADKKAAEAREALKKAEEELRKGTKSDSE
jgi:serine protease Do